MITKVSEITTDNLKDYLRISGSLTAADETYLATILNVAKEYIKTETGIKEENIDKYSDLVIVVFVLCQDMYDTRALYVDENNLNKVVTSILGLHAENLL